MFLIKFELFLKSCAHFVHYSNNLKGVRHIAINTHNTILRRFERQTVNLVVCLVFVCSVIYLPLKDKTNLFQA